MSSDLPSTEKPSPGRLVLPSLAISSFALQPPVILTGLLLVDIASTFGVSVGVAGQIRTASSIVAVIFALIMGALSVRFRHKSLLMIGLLFKSIAALGSAFALDFNMMLLFYPLSGLGAAMVGPMSNALVGEAFPLEKRSSAIGWISASAALSYAVGAPVIGVMAGFGGWRWAFLGFVLPIPLLGLLLAAEGLPSVPRNSQPRMSKKSYMEGFRGVFSNRSADACLVGNALSMAAWVGILTYSASFFRQRFLLSTGFVSIYFLVASLCYTSGSLTSGRWVKRFGRKPLTVFAAFLTGAFVISYTYLPNLWLSMTLAFLGCLFAGMMFTASNSLTLEQVPEFRGTMMSISSAAGSTGSALGTGIGGLALLLFNYEGLGLSLGIMGIAAAIVVHILVTDPTRTQSHDSGA